MFESVEIGHTISKADYAREEPILRHALLAAQYKLLDKKDFPVIVLINGVDGAGKGETVNLLNDWMDPRHIHTHAFGALTDNERARPEMWRFWNVFPPKGKIGILFGSWYTDPILQRVMKNEDKAEFAQRLSRIRDHERMLVAEGALILKFWFHLSKSTQQARLTELSSKKKTAWRITKDDWRHYKHYDEFIRSSELALRESSTGEAPWYLIDGSNHEYRSLTAGHLLLDALQARLKGVKPPVSPAVPPTPPSLDHRNVLNMADYSRKLSRDSYERKLEKLQGEFNLLSRHKNLRERALVIVFEGMDAAGKGSSIRRVTRALDARFYHIVPVAAPNEEERMQPYLWRFWRHIPEHGRAVIFDRSWYGRVLVERVEKFCSNEDWQRAYHEINEFEEQLTRDGAIVIKFWLSISMDEQLKRFKERQQTPHKQYKITPDDWRNRKKWPKYETAVSEMIARTSTDIAPWHVIASDDQLWSRIEVLKQLCNTLRAELKIDGADKA